MHTYNQEIIIAYDWIWKIREKLFPVHFAFFSLPMSSSACPWQSVFKHIFVISVLLSLVRLANSISVMQGTNS